jgi:hypothetical protein
LKQFLSTTFAQFWCTESEFILRFFPARQVPEKILNDTSKNTENALIEWLGLINMASDFQSLMAN